ncbi:MFS transporter [Desulfurococcus mucosus]|uniref:Major facilitator superfamily MFS_1 n=1 Tax=Desulfurococcus mucosus (strain ATCC 35584 / DSM 2162 / JCM 9187 / O7/1) TaxID=765177 RepID=E8R8J9_DESM0|nr:MFS transporter [Desulfurococcus mucosus]ADV64825.1 major facilitator superfamily MFS_1 [Desulfurococcus mucosus DSM 2162]
MSSRLLTVFIILGLVSLFADMAYEGAISVRGSYLSVIGAPVIAAGLAGVGWLASYGSRFLSGVVSDYFRRPRVLWLLVFTGYFVNVIAIPLLAFTRRWELVIALIVFERLGKGLRAPARDVILAEVSEGMGKGLGFGIHEAMDQAGAVLGPLIASLILASSSQDYSRVFTALGVPGAVAVILVAAAWFLYPSPKSITARGVGVGFKGLTRGYYVYTLGFIFFGLGLVSWDIVGYYARSTGFTGDYIALLYTVAMLVDGVLAIPSGILYDRVGVRSAVLAPLAAAVAGVLLPLLQVNPFIPVVAWGLAMGAYETNVRVAVADLVPREKRAFAYGLYGLAEGLAVFTGGIIQAGILGSAGIQALAIYIAVVELLGAAVFTVVR